MIKRLLTLNFLLISLIFTASAQTDTTHYDLGRILIKKDLTQNITIKGSDLERYQFSNLADAINVWLYGTYSNTSSIVYMVNGNIINDINIYSIYDIDEITLIQNALAQISGANQGKQLVIVKLRKNKFGKQGFEVSGQTSIVNMGNPEKTPDVKSTTNIYNQYYISGYENLNGANLGLSVDYQRDVLPSLNGNGYSASDPFHFNRFKLNAYADIKLWKGTIINLGVNYTPQSSQTEFNNNTQPLSNEYENDYENGRVAQHLFSPTVALNTHIINGLSNTISVAYTHYTYSEHDSTNNVNILIGSPSITRNDLATATNKTNNILIRDNLFYHFQLGPFEMEPEVNFSYRKFDNNIYDSTFGTIKGEQFVPSFSTLTLKDNYKLLLLSPSLDITVKNVFNIQGGFVNVLNTKDYPTIAPKQHVFPFLTSTLDILKLWDINAVTLSLFGSFSRQNQLLADSYSTLMDLGLTANLAASYPNQFNNSNFNLNYIQNYILNPYKLYNNYQAGVMLGLNKNFSINYTFESKFNQTPTALFQTLPNNSLYEYIGGGYYYNQLKTNRIGLYYDVNSHSLNWRAGLNIAQTKVQIIDYLLFANFYNTGYLSKGHRYSGGFTNRFAYKQFFAGLDVLYQLGERPISVDNATGPNSPIPASINSFSLQNIYIGSQIKNVHLKYSEIFINARNIVQNKTSDITDSRRFYGVGIKLGL